MKRLITGVVLVFMAAPLAHAQMGKGRRNDTNHGMMMGNSMMMRHGMGVCPMENTNGKVDVQEIKNGITITITSDDKDEIRRIKKRGNILKLMHELNNE